MTSQGGCGRSTWKIINRSVQKDGFVAAEATVQLDIALTRKLGAGFFGGEGFILQRLRGPGIAFIHAGVISLNSTSMSPKPCRVTPDASSALTKRLITTSAWPGASQRQFSGARAYSSPR